MAPHWNRSKVGVGVRSPIRVAIRDVIRDVINGMDHVTGVSSRPDPVTGAPYNGAVIHVLCRLKADYFSSILGKFLPKLYQVSRHSDGLARAGLELAASQQYEKDHFATNW